MSTVAADVVRGLTPACGTVYNNKAGVIKHLDMRVGSSILVEVLAQASPQTSTEAVIYRTMNTHDDIMKDLVKDFSLIN